MSLVKKIIFSIFIVASLVFGVWGYNALKQNKKPSKDVLALLPDSCTLYCSTKNFNDLNVKLNSQNLIFNSWTVFNNVKELKEDLRFYDSLIYSNDLLNEITENNTIHFAAYNYENKTSWIAAFNLKELKQEKDIQEFCKSYLKTKSDKLFSIGRGSFLSIEQGAVVISNSEALIKKVFEKGNKLKANKLFLYQIESVGQSDMMRLYIDHTLYTKSSQNNVLKIGSILNAEESVAGVKVSPTEIILNGNYKPNDNFLQQIISSQEPLNISIYEQLPFETNYFKAIAISSSESLKKIITSKEVQIKFWNELNKKALYNAANEFYGCIENSIVEFSSFNSQALMISINDTAKCKEFIQFIRDRDTLYNNVFIYHLNRKDVVEGFFADLFDVKANHAFILNNALYITESQQSAREIIYSITKGSTLKNNSTFMTYANENLNAFCNYMYYIIPNANNKKVKELTAFNVEKNKSTIENLNNANIVVTKQKGNFKFRMHLNYQAPSSENIPNMLWQCQLDSDIVSKPYLFTNHNTQESEILVQDKLNQLYLINSTGTVLWKKKINETVSSEIFTVDLFRNKKYQLLFNTDNYLHLIDRNGNYVQGYPIKLPAQATNAISLLDYNGDKDFRIFIACKNNLIYNFNLYGVRSEGFKPYKTDAPVKLPIQFVRVGESDYLVTIDEAGVIQAFSRKGVGRIGLKNKAIEHCQDFAIVGTNNINRTFLYYIDEKNNLINRISFGDKKEIIKLNKDLTNAHIKFKMINDDQTPDFMAQSVNGLIVSDINGASIYENEKLNASGFCNTNKSNVKQLYYVFDKEKQKILISNNGSIDIQEVKADSDPSVFNLFKDEKNYMIYSYKAKLICNLLK